MTADLLVLLARSLSFAGRVVRALPAGRLAAPTPCPGMTVEDVAAHLLGGLAWFAALPGGGPGDPRDLPQPDLEGDDLAEDDLAERFRAVSDRVEAAWTPERLHARFSVPAGDVSGAGLAAYMVVELLGHGWDMAAGAGQPVRPPEDLAEAGLALAVELGGTLRAPGMMGPPAFVPAAAPAVERFVAFIGRDPGGAPRR